MEYKDFLQLFKYKDKLAEEVTSLTKQITENKINQVDFYFHVSQEADFLKSTFNQNYHGHIK